MCVYMNLHCYLHNTERLYDCFSRALLQKLVIYPDDNE